MSSSYPVLSHAVLVSGGMVVGVPLELLASPLKNGRLLGDGDRSALVIGGTGKVRAGDAVVFCKVVAVAEAQVKRDGQVRAKGSPVHHATLGPLEERLEAKAGPGVIGRIAGNARLDRRFVRGERERLLAAAFMIRVIVLMTLMPEARIEDVIAALAGDLALVPWARPWRPASARATGDWRNALGPAPLEELRDTVLGPAWQEHQGRGCPGAVTIGKTRPLKAGSLDGTLARMPDTPGSPDLVRQELAAWAAGVEMTRGVARDAALAAAPARKGKRAGLPVRPRDLSFARALRAVLSAIRLGSACYQAVTREIGRCRNTLDRHRHRARKSKSPSSFAHAKDTAARIAPTVITMANTPA